MYIPQVVFLKVHEYFLQKLSKENAKIESKKYLAETLSKLLQSCK